MTLRCGRLDRHEPHAWQGRPVGAEHHRTTYHCTGHVITEGAWREYAKQADADDEAALVLRDMREWL